MTWGSALSFSVFSDPGERGHRLRVYPCLIPVGLHTTLGMVSQFMPVVSLHFLLLGRPKPLHTIRDGVPTTYGKGETHNMFFSRHLFDCPSLHSFLLPRDFRCSSRMACLTELPCVRYELRFHLTRKRPFLAGTSDAMRCPMSSPNARASPRDSILNTS